MKLFTSEQRRGSPCPPPQSELCMEKNPTTEKLVLAQGARLGGSSHLCGDGVDNAQSSVLQGEAQTAQLLL